jgi:hypothetical protein
VDAHAQLIREEAGAHPFPWRRLRWLEHSPGSDGEMLSRFGDCVVITVNHRLSALGYLWLG